MHDYLYYEKRERKKYTRRSIDGKMVSCTKCVGYCCYEEHEGFLTTMQRDSHDCIEKECIYYLPKLREQKRKKAAGSRADEIVRQTSNLISEYEGMRIMSAGEMPNGGWNIKYVTVTNAYPIEKIEKTISESIGESIQLVALNYDFNIAAHLVFSN